MADSFRKYSCLEHLSVERLEELLDLAVNTDDENSEYVDTLLAVMVKKEKSHPTGRIRDVDKAWADFQTYYNTEDGRGQASYYSEDQSETVAAMPENRGILRNIWKAASTAAAAAICLFASMIFAQAAGFNVLGVVARCTDHAFSFAEIQPETIDISSGEEIDSPAEEPQKSVVVLAASQELSYSSFQEALDAYAITEVSEPTNLPNGYVLDRISGVTSKSLTLDARYTNGSDIFVISLISHNDHPSMQLEKTDEPAEVTNVNDIDCYFLKNTDNYTVTWLTEHYECFVFAPLEMEKNTLQKIIFDILD